MVTITHVVTDKVLNYSASLPVLLIEGMCIHIYINVKLEFSISSVAALYHGLVRWAEKATVHGSSVYLHLQGSRSMGSTTCKWQHNLRMG